VREALNYIKSYTIFRAAGGDMKAPPIAAKEPAVKTASETPVKEEKPKKR
jgi:hypothetical protein